MSQISNEFKLPLSEKQLKDLIKDNTDLKMTDLRLQIKLSGINIENLEVQKARLDNQIGMQRKLIAQNENELILLENALKEGLKDE